MYPCICMYVYVQGLDKIISASTFRRRVSFQLFPLCLACIEQTLYLLLLSKFYIHWERNPKCPNYLEFLMKSLSSSKIGCTQYFSAMTDPLQYRIIGKFQCTVTQLWYINSYRTITILRAYSLVKTNNQQWKIYTVPS